MEKFIGVMRQSAVTVKAAEQMLCDLDSKTGDGDHGITMGKVAEAIIRVCDDGQISSPHGFFDGAYNEIISIDGGSMTPLWGMMMDGIAEALDGQPQQIDGTLVKRMFAGALEGFTGVSDAKPGEKTALDALLPAVGAAQKAGDAIGDILAAAARAAEAGAESTKTMLAKYGRAKNLGERSLGALDPGAVSMATFIAALDHNYKEV